VGDDERDIIAGREAGMHTVAAAWGYCSEADPRTWNANATLESSVELGALLTRWGIPA
jgi:phosphoglycolate phosphatase